VRSVPKAGIANSPVMHAVQKPSFIVFTSLFPKLARGEELKNLEFILVNAVHNCFLFFILIRL
jgi:hypothetical protein